MEWTLVESRRGKNLIKKKHFKSSSLYRNSDAVFCYSFKPVMGIVHSGAVSTQVRAQPDLLWPVPAHWDLEDAATVPLAYVQAFYILVSIIICFKG